MIDWHSHILPGIDDGPETLAESLEMARLLAAAGFRQVHCTPHCILGRFDNRPSQVQKATFTLQKELNRAGIPLLLSPGMEYFLDEYFPVLLEKPQCLGDSRLLLVEVPREASSELVRDNVQRIIQRGLIPLMAHPERTDLLAQGDSCPIRWPFNSVFNRFFPSNTTSSFPGAAPSGLFLQDELKGTGGLFQGNLLSFSGRYGKQVLKRAEANLTQGLYSCFATDGHGVESLEAFLLPALQILTNHEGGLNILDSGSNLAGAIEDNCDMQTPMSS